MRCHICDKFIPAPTFNHDTGTYDPCSSCVSMIEETVADYDKKEREEADWGNWED